MEKVSEKELVQLTELEKLLNVSMQKMSLYKDRKDYINLFREEGNFAYIDCQINKISRNIPISDLNEIGKSINLKLDLSSTETEQSNNKNKQIEYIEKQNSINNNGSMNNLIRNNINSSLNSTPETNIINAMPIKENVMKSNNLYNDKIPSIRHLAEIQGQRLNEMNYQMMGNNSKSIDNNNLKENEKAKNDQNNIIKNDNDMSNDNKIVIPQKIETSDEKALVKTGIELYNEQLKNMPIISHKHLISEKIPVLSYIGLITGIIIGWSYYAENELFPILGLIISSASVGLRTIGVFLINKITGQTSVKKQIEKSLENMEPEYFNKMIETLERDENINIIPNRTILKAINKVRRKHLKDSIKIIDRENQMISERIKIIEFKQRKGNATKDELIELNRFKERQNEIYKKTKPKQTKQSIELFFETDHISKKFYGNFIGRFNIFSHKNNVSSKFLPVIDEMTKEEENGKNPLLDKKKFEKIENEKSKKNSIQIIRESSKKIEEQARIQEYQAHEIEELKSKIEMLQERLNDSVK